MKPEYIYMTVIAPSFVLLPLITALLKYRSLPAEARILFFYFILESAVIVTSSLLAYNHIPNMPLYHVAAVAETVVIVYFFIAVFKNKRIRLILKWAIPAFVLLACMNSLFVQHIYEFNSYTLSLQSGIIITLCFLYRWHNENDALKTWSSLPLNWIISGLLLYYCGSFVLLTFSNAVIAMSSKNISVLLWNIHVTLAVIMYILISIGFYKYKS